MTNRRRFIKSSLQAGLTGYLGFQAIDCFAGGPSPAFDRLAAGVP